MLRSTIGICEITMQGLIGLLDDAERKIIETHTQTNGVRHPAWTAMNANEITRDYERAPSDYLVNESIDKISCQKAGRDWLARNKQRVVQTEDPTDCAAILAEIRCFGAMLQAGFTIEPISPVATPTPDFKFELDRHTGVIEVASKQEDSKQVQRSEILAAGGLPEGAERSTLEARGVRIDFCKLEKHPFGAPNPDKPGDTTQANAISRICGIKQEERQFPNYNLSLIWIDFRNLGDWPNMLTVDQTSPLISGHNGTVTSGALWYGFYGWQGAPILEESRLGVQSTGKMQHFGRFRAASKPSKCSAAIICLSEATVLFENPSAAVPLTESVRQHLLRLPYFDIAHSVVDWQPGNLQDNIKLSTDMIEAIGRLSGQEQ